MLITDFVSSRIGAKRTHIAGLILIVTVTPAASRAASSWPLARDLALLGRGQLRSIRTYHDVAPALSAMFAS